MKSSIQIVLDADRNQTPYAIYAAVYADLEKIADMLQAGEAGQPIHRHLREFVARRLITAIMPRDICIEADEVVSTLFRMAADVDRRTHDLEMDEELYGEADTLAKAYANAVQDRRMKRDIGDDDRPAHPSRAAFGRGAL